MSLLLKSISSHCLTPSHEDEDQDQEGEDQDHEMDDEDREPWEGEDQEEEEVWEVAEPPVPVPTLYQRFRPEHPLEQVGRTTFFNNRPAHILKSSSLQTFGCLCQTHENAGLMLKALRSVVPSTISVSPDTFCGDYPDAESVSTGTG